MAADPPLDRTMLAPLVHALFHDPAAELVTWRADPLTYDRYLPGRTLTRVSGTALTSGAPRPWSLILKTTQPPQDETALSDEGWKREARAYASGVLADLPGPLRAPRAFAVSDDAVGRTWLWLEEVDDCLAGAWPLAQFARAATHLGQFNGAYLAGRPLPAVPSLLSDWATLAAQPTERVVARAELGTLVCDARVQHAFPFPIAERAACLLEEVPRWVEILGHCPQTLCHHDASQANLLAHRSADTRVETVAIDWEYLGPGPVGAELAPLVVGTLRRGTVPAERAHALDRAVFAPYLHGLQAAGWPGNPDVVRLGYTAAVALRWSILTTTLHALTDDTVRARLARRLQTSEDRAVQHFTALSRYLVACRDEACVLAHRVSSLL